MQHEKVKSGKACLCALPECHFALIVQGLTIDNS